MTGRYFKNDLVCPSTVTFSVDSWANEFNVHNVAKTKAAKCELQGCGCRGIWQGMGRPCFEISVRNESGTQVLEMTDEKQDIGHRHHAGIMQVGRTRGKIYRQSWSMDFTKSGLRVFGFCPVGPSTISHYNQGKFISSATRRIFGCLPKFQ